MDGIFGVGIAEMVLIALALFIVGGPENSAKWARQAGKLVSQLRQQWAEVMSQVERELGPDGKEIMDATRELSRNAQDLRRVSSPRKLMSETSRYVERSVKDVIDSPLPDSSTSGEIEPGTASPASAPASDQSSLAAASNDQAKYGAWVARDKD